MSDKLTIDEIKQLAIRVNNIVLIEQIWLHENTGKSWDECLQDCVINLAIENADLNANLRNAFDLLSKQAMNDSIIMDFKPSKSGKEAINQGQCADRLLKSV